MGGKTSGRTNNVITFLSVTFRWRGYLLWRVHWIKKRVTNSEVVCCTNVCISRGWIISFLRVMLRFQSAVLVQLNMICKNSVCRIAFDQHSLMHGYDLNTVYFYAKQIHSFIRFFWIASFLLIYLIFMCGLCVLQRINPTIPQKYFGPWCCCKS